MYKSLLIFLLEWPMPKSKINPMAPTLPFTFLSTIKQKTLGWTWEPKQLVSVWINSWLTEPVIVVTVSTIFELAWNLSSFLKESHFLSILIKQLASFSMLIFLGPTILLHVIWGIMRTRAMFYELKYTTWYLYRLVEKLKWLSKWERMWTGNRASKQGNFKSNTDLFIKFIIFLLSFISWFLKDWFLHLPLSLKFSL